MSTHVYTYAVHTIVHTIPHMNTNASTHSQWLGACAAAAKQGIVDVDAVCSACGLLGSLTTPDDITAPASRSVSVSGFDFGWWHVHESLVRVLYTRPCPCTALHTYPAHASHTCILTILSPTYNNNTNNNNKHTHRAFPNARRLASWGAASHLTSILCAIAQQQHQHQQQQQSTTTTATTPVHSSALMSVCSALKGLAANDDICKEIAEEGGLTAAASLLQQGVYVMGRGWCVMCNWCSSCGCCCC